MMITPIRTLTIDQICERKNDLLISIDDIKELARSERAKAIDEFAEKLCNKADWIETYTRAFGHASITIRETAKKIAEQMKGRCE